MKESHFIKVMKRVEHVQGLIIHDLIHIEGIKFTIGKELNHNFKDIKYLWDNERRLYISNENCNDTIFNTKQGNINFRIIHDYLHVTNDLDFSLGSELKIAELQAAMYANYSFLHKKDIYNYVYTDISEQIKYYYDTGKFVKNQREFILNKLGIN